MHRTLTYSAYHQNVRLYRGDTGNDTYTKLLLHCDGADAATAFTDSASGGKTVTANGNAQIDTAQSKFGGASALFDGTGDYLSLVDHADWNFGTGAVTVDFWVRFNSVAGTQALFSQYVDADNLYTLFISGGNIVWQDYESGNIIYIIDSWSPSTNTWYHIALIRGWGGNANTWAICVNGTAVATGTDASAVADFAGSFFIGSASTSNYLNGWIDEFRISKGIARWTANFAPRTAPYR